MQKILALKKTLLTVFILLCLGSAFSLGQLKFSFDFGQFFPEGDEDLIFYRQFTKEFGTDDNFLLVAVKNHPTVFERDFLERFHKLCQNANTFPYVTESQSLTTLSYPLKTSFGYIRLPIIHRENPQKYIADLQKIKEDGLFVNALIDEKATSLVLALETEDKLDHDQSIKLLAAVRRELDNNGLNNYHLLGRSYFYEALVSMQKNESIFTGVAALALITLTLFLVYRRIVVVLVALVSVSAALLLFLGLLSVLGKELNAMAVFYPILLLIVGTSDVIHIVDNYLYKLGTGFSKQDAILSTLREVGRSTLLTSVTTAIGFATLLTSKSSSISEFGINAALGVLVAFVTVVFLTSILITWPRKSLVLPKKNASDFWDKGLARINRFTKTRHRSILYGSLAFALLCIVGITEINTNYQIKESLPTGSTIAGDFEFFQRNYSGFRPLEVAVSAKKNKKVTDFPLVRETEKVVQHLKARPEIQNVRSANTLYKAIHKAHHLNKSDSFVLPPDPATLKSYKRDARKLARKQWEKFVNPDETKTRIRARVLDIGTDTLNGMYAEIRKFINTETDTAQVDFRLTGSGVLLDKNSFYIRESLMQGLLMGLLLVALVMALLFRNLKMLLIALLPNLLPLLFAGALLGFFGIPLEAMISVVFAIVFGIAVDDSIHFLGRYKIGVDKGLDKEEALRVTFLETGRALIITTMTLFFGFLILLFSVHAPSVTIGLLVSVTLLAALVLDLLLLPVLVRRLLN
ncbi:MAG: MMPL family transporter [Pricia sp.]